MYGGKHNNIGREIHFVRKGVLTDQERELALKLRAQRMGWPAVSRATGRSIPDLRYALDPTWRTGDRD